VVLDFPPKAPISENGELKSHGIAALGIDYSPLKTHVLIGKSIIDFEQEGSCAICHHNLEHDEGIYTICSNPECSAVTHMTCLSKHFLKYEAKDSLLPIKGNCPSCKKGMRWIDVMKELTLRMRGQKQVEKLLKEKRVRKTKIAAAQAVEKDEDEDEEEDEEEDAEIELLQDLNPDAEDLEFGDSWHAIDDDSDISDADSLASNGNDASKPKKTISFKPRRAKKLGTVMEDSD